MKTYDMPFKCIKSVEMSGEVFFTEGNVYMCHASDNGKVLETHDDTKMLYNIGYSEKGWHTSDFLWEHFDDISGSTLDDLHESEEE